MNDLHYILAKDILNYYTKSKFYNKEIFNNTDTKTVSSNIFNIFKEDYKYDNSTKIKKYMTDLIDEKNSII